MSKIDLGKVGGFVRHYGSELTVLAGVLRSLTSSLPIDAGDRDNINGALDQIALGAKRAADGAAAVAGEVAVAVRASDVRAAVTAFLSSPEGAKALDERVNSAVAAALAKMGAHDAGK